MSGRYSESTRFINAIRAVLRKGPVEGERRRSDLERFAVTYPDHREQAGGRTPVRKAHAR